MSVPLPPWPSTPPAHGPVVLREVTAADLPMALELAADPYVPLIGTLPAHTSVPTGRAAVGYSIMPSARGRGFAAVALTAAVRPR